MSGTPIFDKANEAWDAGRDRQAFALFLKAAEAGECRAFLSLGFFFDLGISVPKSRRKALYWYKKAARSGDIFAYNNIGTVYRDSGNFERARFWFLKALKSNDLDAALELGKLYIKRGNKGLAKKYLRIASRKSAFSTLDTQETAYALLQKLPKKKKN